VRVVGNSLDKSKSAGALLALRPPEEAREAYAEVLTAEPRNRSALMGRFYAEIEIDDFSAAFPLSMGWRVTTQVSGLRSGRYARVMGSRTYSGTSVEVVCSNRSGAWLQTTWVGRRFFDAAVPP